LIRKQFIVFPVEAPLSSDPFRFGNLLTLSLR